VGSNHSYNRTNAEKILAKALRGSGISFFQNREIEGFEVDFLIPNPKMIIEVDGFTHLSQNKRRADIYKEEQLTQKGYTVLRFTNTQVREDLPGCLAEIEAYRKNLATPANRKTINDLWKNELKKFKPLPKEPPRKPPQSIEEYFLNLEDE